MKVPARLRPRWRDLPGIAVATIQAYIDDFPTSGLRNNGTVNSAKNDLDKDHFCEG